jgi:hypothetical protein
LPSKSIVMRPFLATLALALAVAGSLLLSVAQAGVRTEQRADALFLLPERNGVRPAIWVSGVTGSGWSTAGFNVVRGFCADDMSTDGCAVEAGRGVSGATRGGDIFEVDPDLGSARLKVTRDRFSIDISWTGTDELDPVANVFDCGDVPQGLQSGIMRTGSAAGTVFGRKVRVSSDQPSYVAISDTAWTC